MRNDDIRLAARLLIRVLKGETLERALEVSGAALASATDPRLGIRGLSPLLLSFRATVRSLRHASGKTRS